MTCINRWGSLVVLIACAGAVGACAHVSATSAAQPSPDAPATTAPAVSGVHRALDRRVAEYHVEEMPLNDALNLLHEKAGINVVVNWPAMESAGVSKSTRLSMFVREVSASDLLRAILAEAGGGTNNLWYVVEGDVVVIAPRDTLAAKYRSVRVYPIGFAFADLDPESLQAGEAAAKAREQVQSVAGTGTWRDEGGTGWARVYGQHLIVEQADEIQDEVAAVISEMRGEHLARIRVYEVGDLLRAGGAPAATKAQQLAEVLRTTCGRGTWRDAGGTSSSLAFFGGTLCVNAPLAVHEQIEHELALLRAKKSDDR